MKKLVISLSLITSTLLASIGEIKALKGEASLIHNGTTVALKIGSTLEEHDELKTASKSKLQIVFKDKTVISLGQNSHFKVDEYIYEDKDVSAKFSVSKGFFKSITGRIGKIAPKRFKVKTANATIGVRGTTIIGEVRDKRDIIACSSGQIIVSNDKGSMVVNAGERTIVDAMKMPRQSQKINSIILKKLDSKSNPSVVETDAKIESSMQKDKKMQKDANVADEKTSKKFEPWSGSNDTRSLKDIQDVVGSATPTYNGKVVEGSSSFGKIDKDSSDVRLGFDLGDGSMNGNMKFKDSKNNNYDIEVAGKINGDGNFDFSSNNGYNGAGDGKLSGEKLQNANGDFGFSSKDIITNKTNKIDGKFQTSRK